ncbi:MAG: M20 family metallo-hydrolase [Alphaproteobacteria bacterium]|nr:M20 family metallo-hydrolase [Alphaproteobacteria bacterium]
MGAEATDNLETATAAVNERRLWKRHLDMAKIGQTPKGGVDRQALTPEDIQARALLADWAAELGFEIAMDEIGNMFVRRNGIERDAAPVMTGSHIDTQPTGGRFDGIYGVLAGLEALQAIEDAGIATRRPLEAVVWTNEEGSRFMPGCMGSSVFAEPDRLEQMLCSEDVDGVTVTKALTELRMAMPGVRARPLGSEVAAFIEAHIEQGPELEATNNTIGIVTGIQGTRRFLIEVHGEDAHAGTTPRKHRRDALSAAVAMVGGLERLMYDEHDTIRFTVGRFVVSPNAPSVVPGHVAFTIDFRQPEQEILTRLGDQVETVCRENARACAVKVSETSQTAPIKFEGLVPDTINSVAKRLDLPHMHIYSGASHDAQNLIKICPTGMIFVPCEKGISHNEAENAAPGDLAAGARVLAGVMVAIANR